MKATKKTKKLNKKKKKNVPKFPNRVTVKHPPRKLSKDVRAAAKKSSREADLLAAMEKEDQLNLTAEELEKTKKYLNDIFQVSPDLLKKPAYLWRNLSQNAQNQALIRVSRKKYLQAYQYISSLYVSMKNSPNKEELKRELLATLELKPSKRHDLVALIARTVIAYGDKDDGGNIDNKNGDATIDEKKESNANQARKYISRDAGAIRYLLEIKKIPPYGIIAYQKEHGGGGDSWYREYSKIRAGNRRSAPKIGAPEFHDRPEPKEPSHAEKQSSPQTPSKVTEQISETQSDPTGDIVPVKPLEADAQLAKALKAGWSLVMVFEAEKHSSRQFRVKELLPGVAVPREVMKSQVMKKIKLAAQQVMDEYAQEDFAPEDLEN